MSSDVTARRVAAMLAALALAAPLSAVTVGAAAAGRAVGPAANAATNVPGSVRGSSVGDRSRTSRRVQPGRSSVARVLGVQGVPSTGVRTVTARIDAWSRARGVVTIRVVGTGRAPAKLAVPARTSVSRQVTLPPGPLGLWRIGWTGRRPARLGFTITGFAPTSDSDPGGAPPGDPDPGGGAPSAGGPRFDIGNPTVRDLWVDPVLGRDGNSGSARATAVRTVAEAWRRIPAESTLGTGVRVQLVAGSYAREDLPGYLEHRWGTQSAPVIFNAVDGSGTAVLRGDLNLFDVRHLYLTGVSIRVEGDAFHCERCSYVLLRAGTFDGGGAAHETIKVNQSDHFMIEDSVVAGAYENAIDFVAVQYGHIRGNEIRQSGDWCAYVKGGSAHLTVAENEIHDCGTGGFTAGQGTGFEFMTSPWLHYEAVDIKVVNNVIHDTWGAGLGVNGGYNVLLAFNTLYRVGSRSHAVEFVFGGRGCDGDTAACASRNAAGGWGSTASEGDGWIPNRHVYFYNNVIYNPEPFRSEWSHFAVYGPRAVPPGVNLSGPARTDDDLRIVGNIVWNGPASAIDLGVGDGAGCAATNPTCNATQLVRDNLINTSRPVLRDPGAGDYGPAPGGAIASIAAVAAPDFGWSDRPANPLGPVGTSSNAVPTNRDGATRESPTHPGAY